MAHINPIGGLVEISELNTDTSSIFYEDFSDPEDSIPSGPSAELSTNSPLVPKSHRRRRIKASRVNKKQLNYRTRLVFRVVSLIASGTTFGSLASLLYSYNGTKAATHGGGKVWPDDIQLNSTMVMLAAAVVTFVSDLALFIASAKQSVRRLEGAAMKALALATALVCASLCVAGVTIGEVWEMDPGTKTLMWTCFAKTQVWDESVTVDFPYLCGEMLASRWALIATLGFQCLVLATVIVDIFYKGGPKKPKAYVSKEFKVLDGWRGFLDKFSRS